MLSPELHHDAWNRLVKVYEDDDGLGVYEPGTDDTLTAQYEYDGRNRRIEKAVTGANGVHYYYNQQWQMLEEVFVDGQGTRVAANEYVWSPDYVDSPIVRFHDGNGDGDCDPVNDAGDSIRWYTTDANHNVTTTITVGHTSTVTEHYVYDAYGKATACDDDWDAIGAPSEDGPLYCGYFFDAETAIYQVRNRYYDSSLSTWISRDPIGYAARCANLYEYVGDSPTNRTDPSGLQYFPYIPPPPPAPKPGPSGGNGRRPGGIGYINTRLVARTLLTITLGSLHTCHQE